MVTIFSYDNPVFDHLFLGLGKSGPGPTTSLACITAPNNYLSMDRVQSYIQNVYGKQVLTSEVVLLPILRPFVSVFVQEAITCAHGPVVVTSRSLGHLFAN
jgi:hypothetical protein